MDLLEKKNILMNAYFQFSIQLLSIGLDRSRSHNNHTSFVKLLEKDSSVSVYNRSIQYLAAEMYKVSNGLSQTQMYDILKHKNSHLYNLRHDFQFSTPLVKHVFHVPKAYLI